MTTIIFGILEEGLVYAIMALGVYITYKILDFPDLSVDGTFPLGAAVTAAGIANGLPFIGTISPVAALFISFTVGALAGCITGLIHVKLKVRDLLSGIIVMTALYSINLRIAGKANLPIFSKETIFSNSFLSAHVPEDGICLRYLMDSVHGYPGHDHYPVCDRYDLQGVIRRLLTDTFRIPASCSW